MDVAHLAVELGARHQGGDRVDHQDVDGAGAHQGIGDLQRLLAGVGLGDQQLIDVDAELAGIDRIEGVFGVDEGAGAAQLLGLTDDVERHRRLPRGFGPVDLDHPAPRQAADAKRDVEPKRAAGDGLGFDDACAFSELHDRALAEGPFDLAQRGVECLLFVHIVLVDQLQ